MGKTRSILTYCPPEKAPKLSDRKKSPECVGNVPITKQERLNGFKAIEKKIEELNRGVVTTKPNTRSRAKSQTLPESAPPVLLIGRSKDGTPGNNPITESTYKRYQSDWKGLLDFCILIQDWESAIILHRSVSPKDSPPVSSLTASLYLKFMVLPKDTPVTHPQTDEPIHLPNGKGPILAVGAWTSKSTIHSYKQALSKVHSLHPSTAAGPYTEQCEVCHAIPLECIQRGHTCHIHTSRSRYWRTGNVANDQAFLDCVKTHEKYVDTHFETKSAVAFLPSELRQMREHLLAMNNLEGLMLWCIIILGVRLFLRVEEVLTLTIESFQQKYFLIKGNDIHSLLLKVQGKTDPLPVLFQVWEDNICPDFSPVRPLLLFLGLTGRKSGLLFPALEKIREPHPTSKHYDYENVLSDMRHLCYKILKKDLSTCIGLRLIASTHSLRKTAFLLAYWGMKMALYLSGTLGAQWIGNEWLSPEDQACLLKDARHASANMTMTYLQDSPTLLQLWKTLCIGDPTMKVSPYRPIFVLNPANLHPIGNTPSNRIPPNKKSLPEVAEWFLSDVLKNNSMADDVQELWKRTLKLKQETAEDNKSLRDILDVVKHHLPPNIFNSVKTNLDNYILQICNNTAGTPNSQEAGASESTLPHPPPALAPTTEQTATAVPAIVSPPRPNPNNMIKGRSKKKPKKPPMVLSKDFITLSGNSKLPAATRVQYYIEGYAEARLRWLATPPTTAIRNWFYKAGPIAICVQECHDNDIARFVDMTSQFTTGTFQCAYCKKHSASTK